MDLDKRDVVLTFSPLVVLLYRCGFVVQLFSHSKAKKTSAEMSASKGKKTVLITGFVHHVSRKLQGSGLTELHNRCSSGIGEALAKEFHAKGECVRGCPSQGRRIEKNTIPSPVSNILSLHEHTWTNNTCLPFLRLPCHRHRPPDRIHRSLGQDGHEHRQVGRHQCRNHSGREEGSRRYHRRGARRPREQRVRSPILPDQSQAQP